MTPIFTAIQDAILDVFDRIRGLQTPAWYNQQLAKIDSLAGEKKAERALALSERLLRNLGRAKRLTPEHGRCRGSAYLARGRLQEQAQQNLPAAQSYMAARSDIALPAANLSFLAASLADQKDTREQALAVYFDYLKLTRPQPHDVQTDTVYAFLHSLCRLDEGAAPDKIAATLALNKRVLAADDSVEWACYYRGLALIEQNDYAPALPYFEAARRLNPARKEAAYYAMICNGALSEQKGEYERALLALRNAARLLPDKKAAHLLIGRVLIAASENVLEEDAPGARARVVPLAAEAVSELNRAATLPPPDPAGQFYLGRALSLAGDSQAAVRAFRSAIEARQDRVEYHTCLARELALLGDRTAAMKTVERILALDRNNAGAHDIWGDIATAEAHFDQAEEHYRKALSRNAAHSRARSGLARALYHLKRLPEAVREWEALPRRSRTDALMLARAYALLDDPAHALPLLKGLAERPDATDIIFYHLGCAHACLGRYTEAISAFSASLRLTPSAWRTLLQRGHCHYMAGNDQLALADYEQTLATQPQNREGMLALARLHLRCNNSDKAQTLLNELTGTDPADWEALMMLGVWAERTGDGAGAESAYRRALSARPALADISLRLAVLYCHQGRFAEACSVFEQAANQVSKPEGAESALAYAALPDTLLFHWGYARAQQGDIQAALVLWDALLKKNPSDQRLALNVHRLHYLLGKRYAEAESYAEAITAWEEFLASRPDDEKLKKDIAELYACWAISDLAAGRPVDASRKRLLRARELSSDHPLAAFSMALCDLADKQPKRAMEQLERLPDGQSPTLHIHAQYHRAVAALALGEPSRAATILRSVLSHPSANELGAPARWLLAIAYARSEQWQDALSALATASA